MLVRRYQGRNEKEAIDKAKADLGADWVILHIKQLSKNGIFDLKSAAKVEVIVALDQDHQEFGIRNADQINDGSLRSKLLNEVNAEDQRRHQLEAERSEANNPPAPLFPLNRQPPYPL